MNSVTLAPGGLLSVFLLLGITSLPAQELTQTFQLLPGWNAIYLEIELADRRLEPIFTNLPIASVWTWKGRISAADFVQHPDDRLPNQERWLVYYSKSAPESRFNSLFALLPRRAYLIKVKGSTPITLSLKGRPSPRQPDWTPNAFNLRGFPIDPAAPPSFKQFFQSSPAHYHQAQDRLQPIYRLDPAGRWEPAAADSLMRRGEAYWVYTEGASGYPGPIAVEEFSGTAASGDGLDFGSELETVSLRFRNLTDRSAVLSLRNRADSELPLSYQVFPLYGSELPWVDVPNEFNFVVANGASQNFGFAIRRSEFSGSSFGAVLELSDSLGTLVYLPVTAEKFVGTATGPRLSSAAKAQAGNPQRAATSNRSDYSGLWVGSATIQAVSEPHAAPLITNRTAQGGLAVERVRVSSEPTPTKSTFDLRLIFHVTSNGVSRLLKEVTLLPVSAQYTNDLTGNRVLAQSSHTLLLTDRNLFACYGTAPATGERPVGRRLSTVHFDFETPAILWRQANGAFNAGNAISCAITNFPISPTNPFRHKFHPDHDGLDANYEFPNTEVPMIVREIQLEFDATAPSTLKAPDYGYRILTGTYRETISGLHKDPLSCQGNFRLNRIVTTGELDPPCASVRAGP